MADNPYSSLPKQHFWRSGVADVGVFGLQDLWASKWKLPANAAFSTYGSCFAQHISRALARREMNWINAEQAPGRTSQALALRFNYGVYSARTANIYSTHQLLTWMWLADEQMDPEEIELWEDDTGRFRDSLRPAIEPDGFRSAHEARAALKATAYAFRKSVVEADVFVFTLGLTESWENKKTGQCYAMCPGTLAGTFDPETHVFANYDYPRVMADLDAALKIAKALNPDLKILLTVSPVPLTATASDKHVLPATMYSKSVLRAVAGAISSAREDVDYFPSYEIIAGHPTRAMFFEPNLRSVAQNGVDLVMGHFFAGLDLTGDAVERDDKGGGRVEESLAQMEAEELVCEEMTLEKQFNG